MEYLNSNEWNKSVGEILQIHTEINIDIDIYINIDINTLPLSNRLLNNLNRNRIDTLQKLLKMTPRELTEIKGVGKGFVDELFCFLYKIDWSVYYPKISYGLFLNNYKDKLISGDFSFANEKLLNKNAKRLLLKYKKAHELLDKNLILKCVAEKDKMHSIACMFDDYYNESKKRIKTRMLLEKLPIHRQKNKAYGYINAYTLDDEKKTLLRECCDNEAVTVEKMIENAASKSDIVYQESVKFIMWCSFDLEKEIETFFSGLYSKERFELVLKQRSQGKTLGDIGENINITRERVRQIENRIKDKFYEFNIRTRIISKISAELNGTLILTDADISQFCGPYSQELIYLLQIVENDYYTYDKELDIFIIGDYSVHDKTYQYIDMLPDIIKAEQLPEIVNKAKQERDIPPQIFEKVLLETYDKNDKIFYKNRLSQKFIYEKILRKYYPCGVHIYDEKEMNRFKDLVRLDFGEVKSSESKRALPARIAAIGVLCDRGTYKAKQEYYISDELAGRIYRYIDKSKGKILLINKLFQIFKTDLKEEGVNNKYYLQGIIREIFPGKFTITRDYISKGKDNTSKNKVVNNTHISNKTDKKDVMQKAQERKDKLGDKVYSQNDETEKYALVLKKKFSHGYKIDSAIELKRFKRFYESMFHKTIVEPDEIILNTLNIMCIRYENNIYLPENMLCEEKRDKILSYIQNELSKGRKAVYYEILFDHFVEEFDDECINNSEMLKIYLETICKGTYYFGKEYLSKSYCDKIDPIDEVRNFLIEKAMPVHIDEILSSLSYIPESYIKKALQNVCIIKNSRYEYFDLSIIKFTDEEKNCVEYLIDKLTAKNENVVISDIIEKIELNYPDIFERLNMLSENGIKKVLEYNFSVIFKGKAVVNLKVNNYLTDRYELYAKTHETFTIDELKDIRKAYGGTINFDKIYGIAIRVSKRDFVAKKLVHFDIDRVDEVIDDFCTGDYMPLLGVSQFAIFPNCGYLWNSFLLESYLALYSKKYILLHYRYNEATCTGGIVKRSAGIKDYNELLIRALAESELELTNETALNYLLENGYIASRSYQSIDDIVRKAKQKRAEEGM